MSKTAVIALTFFGGIIDRTASINLLAMFRMTLVLPLFLLTAPAPILAQNLNGEWTNGWMVFSGGKVNDSLWALNGSGLHEGGFRFFMKPLTDSSWLLKGHNLDGNPDDHAEPIVGKRGDRVLYRVVDGHRVMIFQSTAGTIDELLVPIDYGQQLSDLVTSNKTAYELGGEYINMRNGQPAVFYSGRPEVKGLFSDPELYYFPAPYDFPDNVLVFGKNKTPLAYTRTDSSLELFVAEDHGEEQYTAGKRFATLRKTGWLDPSRSHLPGRYPFASVLLLTDGITRYFSKAELRIMRNEIYARHGYVFESADLQAYFSSQPWYKPVDGAGEAQLSELEKLNARILAERASRK
jgi:hypothetical protein